MREKLEAEIEKLEREFAKKRRLYDSKTLNYVLKHPLANPMLYLTDYNPTDSFESSAKFCDQFNSLYRYMEKIKKDFPKLSEDETKEIVFKFCMTDESIKYFLTQRYKNPTENDFKLAAYRIAQTYVILESFGFNELTAIFRLEQEKCLQLAELDDSLIESYTQDPVDKKEELLIEIPDLEEEITYLKSTFNRNLYKSFFSKIIQFRDDLDCLECRDVENDDYESGMIFYKRFPSVYLFAENLKEANPDLPDHERYQALFNFCMQNKGIKDYITRVVKKQRKAFKDTVDKRFSIKKKNRKNKQFRDFLLQVEKEEATIERYVRYIVGVYESLETFGFNSIISKEKLLEQKKEELEKLKETGEIGLSNSQPSSDKNNSILNRGTKRLAKIFSTTKPRK